MKSLFTMTSRRPVVTILAVFAITGVLGFFAIDGFRIETDLDEYMPESHPAFEYARQAEEWFDISDGVLMAVHHPDGIYRSETLRKVREFGDALGELHGIDAEEVSSLATADNIVGSDWGLEVRPFFAGVPKTNEELERLEAAVRDNPLVGDRLVSSDGKATLIVARLSEGELSDELYADLRALERDYEGPEEIYVAGRPIVEGALAELGPADMARMGPIVLIVIAAVLFLLLRRVSRAVISLLVVTFSVAWTFGLMALLGIPVYAVSTMIPVMLVAIGVAYSIHVFNSATVYLEEHPEATSRHLADHAISVITKPVVLTAVTTVVGFLSLLTSAVLPVRYFGLFTAFGVFSAMLLSLSLIPSSFVLFGVSRPGNGGTRAGEHGRLARRISDFIIRHAGAVTVGAIALVVVSLFGVTRVWIDSSFLSKFSDDSQIVRTDRFVNAHFAGTSTLNIVLEGDSPGTFKNPAVLGVMARLQQELEETGEVGNTLSIADYLKRLHQVMHSGQEDYFAVPDSQELVAQYLLLYEMSADPDSLKQVVDYDYRRANVTVQLKSDNSRTLERVIAITDDYTEAFDDQGVSIRYAGSGYRALVFSELILEGQIKSLALSLIIVIILLSLMFRSITVGLIGAIPIVLTAIVNFGVMGLVGVPLSSSTALISSIAIGIGIDYAIHFIERYKEYAAHYGNPDRAAALTMHHSGRAILYNAAVVASGFAVLLFSVFPPNRQVGGLMALNMVVSFLGTVTLLFLFLYRGRIFLASKSLSHEEVQV